MSKFTKEQIWGISRKDYYLADKDKLNLYIGLVEVELKVLINNRVKVSAEYRNTKEYSESSKLGELVIEIDSKIKHRENKLRDLLNIREELV